MVKVAIAGGTSNVALEVIDALCAANKHEILLLSRKDVPSLETRPGVTWAKTDYLDVQQLVDILHGTHTLLSFVVTQTDPDNVTQKNLIAAAVEAGVKRFAPSEWTLSSFEHLPWYAGKAEIRQYLKDLNRERTVLKYCLFLPGLFTNYLTHPYKSAEHFNSFEMHIDFDKRRALIMEGSEDDRITLTTAQDFAQIVARAVEYEGKWPVVGGIKGTEITIGELLKLGERVRGAPFNIERLKADDLKAGVVKASWLPSVEHSGTQSEQMVAFISMLVAGMLLGTSSGALNVSDEWNRVFPDYRFTPADEFLAKAWMGKP